MFHFTVDSNKSMEDVIFRLKEVLKEEKFGVLWELNLREKLQEKGLELDKEFVVLEVCNPHEAKRVLTQNTLVGYFLPCKIVVYLEKGKTKIGMPKPTSLISMVSDSELETIAEDIEHRLIGCIEKAK
ncbi:MAG: DUF302 domain-containing protein [Bacillota bacterium]|nr:DUF302 domain-containing protein [Bacillota bacterium]